MSFSLVNNKDKTVETFVLLNMCNSAWLKLTFNLQCTKGEDKCTKLLPAAASFESLVHFCPHIPFCLQIPFHVWCPWYSFIALWSSEWTKNAIWLETQWIVVMMGITFKIDLTIVEALVATKIYAQSTSTFKIIFFQKCLSQNVLLGHKELLEKKVQKISHYNI